MFNALVHDAIVVPEAFVQLYHASQQLLTVEADALNDAPNAKANVPNATISNFFFIFIGNSLCQ